MVWLKTDAIIPASNHMMLWVGQMSETELSDYIDEPGGRIDGQPQSRFAEDLLAFYDHDFLWGQANSSMISIRGLAEKNGITDPKLIAKLESSVSPSEPISCFLILWNYRNLKPLTQKFANGKLRFVGCWSFPAPYTGD
jgi:hypothetical protein